MIKKLYMGKNNKRVVKEGESYGWVVDYGEAWDAYDMACDYFGKDYIADQIASYIGTETLSDALAYIFRQHDFRQWKNHDDEEFQESKKSFARSTNENYKNDRITYTLIGTDEDGEFVTDIDSLSEFNLTKYLCLMLKNSRVYQVGVYSSDYPNDCLDVYTRGESDPTKFNFKVR